MNVVLMGATFTNPEGTNTVLLLRTTDPAMGPVGGPIKIRNPAALGYWGTNPGTKAWKLLIIRNTGRGRRLKSTRDANHSPSIAGLASLTGKPAYSRLWLHWRFQE